MQYRVINAQSQQTEGGDKTLVNVREFAHLCGYRETSARTLLKEYVAAGVMERVLLLSNLC